MTEAATQRTSAESSELRPVTTLRGVGESLAGKLAKLGITTVQDLLFLLPLRYEDRTRVVPIGSLQHRRARRHRRRSASCAKSRFAADASCCAGSATARAR